MENWGAQVDRLVKIRRDDAEGRTEERECKRREK